MLTTWFPEQQKIISEGPEGNNNVRKKSSKQSSEKGENLEKQNFVLSLLGLWCSPPQQSRPHRWYPKRAVGQSVKRAPSSRFCSDLDRNRRCAAPW